MIWSGETKVSWVEQVTFVITHHRPRCSSNVPQFECEYTQLPSNYWRHKITKVKESNRCDLCRDLWITEGRFNTEDDLPIQTLGHIQHQCEALSEIRTLAHQRWWCIIHLASNTAKHTWMWTIVLSIHSFINIPNHLIVPSFSVWKSFWKLSFHENFLKNNI